MPLIVITGYPSSGKSRRAKEIESYFKQNCDKDVILISESNILSRSGIGKNELCFDPKKEKEVRANLKSEVVRLLSPNNVVILDAGNYIKGYRYELYCASKCHKTTQCTVECDSCKESAWKLNESRNADDQYSREAFDALIQRYEPPQYNNRWDSPLITVQIADELPGQAIYDAIYKRSAPPPNESTKNMPLSSSTFLYEVDKITQEVITEILSLKKMGLILQNIRLRQFGNCELHRVDENMTPVQLAKYRRQFISFTKLHPPVNAAKDDIARLFVQFLNSSISP